MLLGLDVTPLRYGGLVPRGPQVESRAEEGVPGHPERRGAGSSGEARGGGHGSVCGDGAEEVR